MMRRDFRIESNHPLRNPLWSAALTDTMAFHDRGLAVVIAAKSRTHPCGGEIRVVHAPTGEVIFRKQDECACHRPGPG